jgi:hypothetical protein
MESNKTLNMISGGKLGDFIHQLYIPAIIYNIYNIKTNLYISEIGDHFSFGLENTFNELHDIISEQEYINTFEIYNNQNINFDLSFWRNQNPQLCWTEKLLSIYLQSANFNIRNFQIIKNVKNIKKYNNSLIINRSLDHRRHSANDLYIKYIHEYGKENSFFIYTDVNQYVNFPHKNLVQPLYIDNIQDLFKIINSCSLFCGNLSAPMAIAYALMKNIVCEIGYVDGDSYKNEKKYYDNILIGE